MAAVGMGAAVVLTSFVASVPYLFSDDAADASSGSALVLFGLIVLTAYRSVRRAGAKPVRAVAFTVLIAVLALIVVMIKYSLTH